MDANSFIKTYARDFLDGKSSVFIGAGVSSTAGLPSWASLLEPCAKDLGISIDEDTDLFLLAQYYVNKHNTQSLKRIINSRINVNLTDSDLVNTLMNLDFKSIWTTNYDNTIEASLLRKGVLMNKVFVDSDLANIADLNRRTIYKLNGDIHNLDNIVITQSDLEEYDSKHEMMLNFLKKELVTNTFLFLGYSFKDNIIKKALSEIRKLLGDSLPSHYCILKNMKTFVFDHFVKDLKSRYGINCVLIDHYDELPLLISEITNETKRKNIFFSGIFDALPNEYEELAKSLLSCMTEMLLSHKCNVHTNYGRNFGNYLCGNSLRYLTSHGINNKSRLVMTPFLKDMTQEEKNKHRYNTMGQCAVSIFMFGQVPVLDENRKVIGYRNARGMFTDEYRIARELNHIIIPIGATGYTAQRIWREMKDDIANYPYLSDKIDSLNSGDAQTIIAAVIDILDTQKIL